MTADDTGRDALVERVNFVLGGHRQYLAERIADAVVMPLVEERDRLRAIAPEVRAAQHLAEVSALSIRDAMAAVGVVAERDAAIKWAEAAEAERDLLEAERDQALAELGRRK